MLDEIVKLTPEEIVCVFNELEAWNETGKLLVNGVVRRIIEQELKNNPVTNFCSAGIAFQMIFYRHLATKYINQTTTKAEL